MGQIKNRTTATYEDSDYGSFPIPFNAAVAEHINPQTAIQAEETKP